LHAESLQSSSIKSLSSLPTEILLAILRHAALFDRCALALTCKFFAEIAVGSGLLRYRTPNHDDILYYQHLSHSRSWSRRVTIQTPQVKYARCNPFPELVVPPEWFRFRFCQGCQHCQSRFVPRWPYIDCTWDPDSSSSVTALSGQDVTARKEAAKGGCKLHPHMPHGVSQTMSDGLDDLFGTEAHASEAVATGDHASEGRRPEKQPNSG
jgi:hypothetical protein